MIWTLGHVSTPPPFIRTPLTLRDVLRGNTALTYDIPSHGRKENQNNFIIRIFIKTRNDNHTIVFVFIISVRGWGNGK